MRAACRILLCFSDLFMKRTVIILLSLSIAAIAGAWAVVRHKFVPPQGISGSGNVASNSFVSNPNAWAEAVEKVKADRAGEGAGAIEIPAELKHYSERHWFLASQVAEVAKHNLQNCQDYLDLASMIQRGDMVPVPGVTETYVLFGVGAKTDDTVFTRWADDKSIELYDEPQLAAALKEIDAKHKTLENEIASLKTQSSRLNSRERSKVNEIQKQIAAKEQELQSVDEDKSVLNQYYGETDTREKLFHDYESLKALASNFGGQAYDINSPDDRKALKARLLSSLRPAALKILEEVAATYYAQFNRPLPVSSLVRPESYQRVLRRVNRNAVLIDTPPHSTGLAFDIDYRYMSAAEQTFLMAHLARLKREGRIEVIRERNANYHVFAFLNGTRPNDDLIAASLEKADETLNPPSNQSSHVKSKAPQKKKKPAKKPVTKRRRR